MPAGNSDAPAGQPEPGFGPLSSSLASCWEPRNTPALPASPLNTVIPLSHSSTIHPISAATTATSSLDHTARSPRKEGKAASHLLLDLPGRDAG